MKWQEARGFTGNMVVIWRNAATANTSGVSHRLPIVSLIFSLSVRRKPVNLSSHDILCFALSVFLFLFPAHFSCLSVTKDQSVWPHAKLSLSLFLCSTSSLHPPLRQAFYCRILSLSPARSDPRYLPLSVVSLPVADMLQLNWWHAHTLAQINSRTHTQNKIKANTCTVPGYMHRHKFTGSGQEGMMGKKGTNTNTLTACVCTHTHEQHALALAHTHM